jgi:uncharacterized protein (DUF924 family)
MKPETLLSFWFGPEAGPSKWFAGGPAFDAEVKRRFAGLYERARERVFDDWVLEARSALALVIALDQLPRNFFRGTARAFESDAHALEIAERALQDRFHRALKPEEQLFLYLPFEHSESRFDQERSVALFSAMEGGDPAWLDYAKRHRDVIQRFGRFPHRNAALGRKNTAAEEEFLKQPGSAF